MPNDLSENTIKKMDECSKIAGAIKQKFPKLFTKQVPSTVCFEYRNSIYILQILEFSSLDAVEKTIASDGMQVTPSQLDHYEEALDMAKILRSHNKIYISNREIEEYKFPEIDTNQIEQKIASLKTSEDCVSLYSELWNVECQSVANRQILNEYACVVRDKEIDILLHPKTPLEKALNTVKDFGDKIVSNGKGVVDSIKEKIFGKSIDNTSLNSSEEDGANNEKLDQ